jgi:hypothetical protein
MQQDGSIVAESLKLYDESRQVTKQTVSLGQHFGASEPMEIALIVSDDPSSGGKFRRNAVRHAMKSAENHACLSSVTARKRNASR